MACSVNASLKAPIQDSQIDHQYFRDETVEYLLQVYLDNSKIVGQATITEKISDSPVEISIHKYKIDDQWIIYLAAIVNELGKQVLGTLNINRFLGDVADVHSYKRGTYAGIGSVLMQVAIERAFLKKQEISLYAAFNSHGFYYKTGLRTKNKSQNKLIKNELKLAEKENRFPNTAQFFPLVVPMYLKPKGMAKWAEIIQGSSLLFKSRKL